MHRGLGLFLTITLGMMIVAGAPRVAGLLSALELFRVGEVSVEGAELLARDEVLAAAEIPEGSKIWDDLEPMATRLKSHPLIVEARVRRRLPRTLVVEVQERRPVALMPNPTLTPVDEDAQPLPISPAGRRMDLPIVRPRILSEDEDRELTPAQLRGLTSELVRLGKLDPSVLASVSEAYLDSWGNVVLNLDRPRVAVRYQAPLASDRLNDGLLVLRDALEREPDRDLISLDLRFSDQVVVRFSDSNQR